MQPPRQREVEPRRMPPELSEPLMEHSPRLIISKPTLIREPASPTGWIVVIPGTEDEVLEQERRLRSGRPNGPVQGSSRP